MRLMLEAEVAATQVAIGKLKALLRATQDKLVAEQAKLPALLECVAVLDNKRLPAPPSPQSAPIFQTTAARHPLQAIPAYEETGVADADGAILADYGVVLKFAMSRSMKFESWDDLPSVNRKREDLDMPTFKRNLREVRR